MIDIYLIEITKEFLWSKPGCYILAKDVASDRAKTTHICASVVSAVELIKEDFVLSNIHRVYIGFPGDDTTIDITAEVKE